MDPKKPSAESAVEEKDHEGEKQDAATEGKGPEVEKQVASIEEKSPEGEKQDTAIKENGLDSEKQVVAIEENGPEDENQDTAVEEKSTEGSTQIDDNNEFNEPVNKPPTDDQDEKKDKPIASRKISIDFTDQIKPQFSAEVNEVDVETTEDLDTEFEAHKVFGRISATLGPPVDLTVISESVEEEEVPEEDLLSYLIALGLQKDQKPPIDREYYEAEYLAIKEKITLVKRKNGVLNKRMTEYFRRRKMARVFEDIYVDMYEEMLDKYDLKIEDFYDYRMKTMREKEAIDSEINDMRTLRDEHSAEFEQSFSQMLIREKEVGHGLIDSNGKLVPDKVIERLIARQRGKSEEIAHIRLFYIKRRDKIREIEAKLKSLETIGGTLHLLDFEQIRMENQTYNDKIEERDDDLMKLRARYSYAMQSLAHTREKIDVIEDKIDVMIYSQASGESHVTRVREYLNSLKIQRDYNRAQAEKLKTNSGILTYPKLIMDMEISMKEVSQLETELEQLKLHNKEVREKIKNIRFNIEKVQRCQATDNIDDLSAKTKYNKKNSSIFARVKKPKYKYSKIRK